MEELPIGSFNCTQTDCSISTTGKCVNGLPIEECKNKIRVTKGTIQESQNFETAIKPQQKNIKWGDSFSEDDLSNITYRYPTNLIVLVGEPYSGKSTLYAALFDSFHKGGCGNFYFNSTRTPIAFERICHLSREKCKGRVPKTERTKSYEFLYLHLSVRKNNLIEEPKHLIFADVNGERYQEAKDNEEAATKLIIFKKADHIFFIADGGLLLKSQERHAVKKDVWNMMTRCLQNNLINSNQKFNLIITKWDEITSNGKIDDVTSFFLNPTLEKFGANISKVIKVASRSMNDSVPPRTGIDEFLNICVQKEPLGTGNFDFKSLIKRQYQNVKYLDYI